LAFKIENIKNLIYTIRGKQVIIVIDKKELYNDLFKKLGDVAIHVDNIS